MRGVQTPCATQHMLKQRSALHGLCNNAWRLEETCMLKYGAIRQHCDWSCCKETAIDMQSLAIEALQ